MSTIQTLTDLLESLGGIDPGRVRARPAPGTATEQDVLTIQAQTGRLCELVDGVLVEKPMGCRGTPRYILSMEDRCVKLKCFAAYYLLPLLCGANPPEAVMEGLRPFQGTWRMVGCIVNGIEAAPADVKRIDLTAVIRGKECTVSIGALGTSGTSNIQVDPSRRPRTVDVFGYWPKERNRRIYGIYRFTGDNLEIALHSDKRPPDFVSREQNGALLIKLKRAQKN